VENGFRGMQFQGFQHLDLAKTFQPVSDTASDVTGLDWEYQYLPG
jgi:hypothetical protein